MTAWVPTAEQVRDLRAVEVLEYAATESAKAVLKKLAAGAEVGAAREARKALRRLPAAP